MEQDFWNQMKDLNSQSAEYFNVISKNEKDMMNQSKNYMDRLRLNREVQFTEDFRKKFMTKDYGNYEKYEKNSVEQELEKGDKDSGRDTFWKNHTNMVRRLNTIEGEHQRQDDKETMEDLLTNDSYADRTIQ